MFIDRSRLVRLLLAGAFAGLVVFFIFNPAMVHEELRRQVQIDFGDPDSARQALDNARNQESSAADMLQMAVFSGAFAAMLGGMLALADEAFSPPKRIAVKMGIAVGVGLAGGAISGLLAQIVFAGLLKVSFVFLLPARILAWATFSVGAGAGLGVALGTWRRTTMCMLGGLVGGCLGGALFDLVGAFTSIVSPTGTASRFIGFILIGLATGAAVAIVEDMAKQSWVTVLSGAKEGRSFILTKPITTIGRNELADIPLFGDTSVRKDHARLLLEGANVMLQSAGNASVAVNGTQTQYTQLRPWDVFAVGGHSLRFHQKASQHHMAYVMMPLPDLTSPQYRPTYASTNQTISQPAVRAATGNLVLVAASGPHLNQRFQFGPGTVRIGREVGCGIVLMQDSVVSRNHAEMTWNGTGWVVRDLQSRNGLWVNGVRVTEHPLNFGDQIGVGQSWLRVEGI